MKALTLIIAATFCLLSLPSVSGAVVFGASGRTQIEDLYNNNGGTFEDFQTLQGQLLTTQVAGADFNTTIQRFGGIQNVNMDMGVIPYGFLTGPTGYITPFRLGNIPDGQSQWEIVFDTPQRWAGLVRNFNTSSFTEFYAGATLLDTHTNTVNQEFVGYIAPTSDTATWVTRIVADGTTISNVYQVGYGDDLFFGTAVPEPSSILLLAFGSLGCILRRKR